MSSLTKDENRQKQVKLGALVATAALATTFAGATAVHADTVRSTPQAAGQVSQTTHSVGFESAATSTGASTATSSAANSAPATSTGSVASSAVASGAQSQAGSTAKSDAGSSAATSSAVKSDAGSKATSTASGEKSNASSAASDGKSGASSAASNSSADSSAAASDWKDTDVEHHVVRTVRITTPNGRTQDYTQTVKLTRTKTEKDGKVVYSAWTDGEWKAFPLVPIDGYNWLINGKEFAPQKGADGKYKSEELPAVKVTEKVGNALVTVTYKKAAATTDDKTDNKGSNAGSTAGSSATNSSAASDTKSDGKASGSASDGSATNDGKTATDDSDVSTTKTASLGDVMNNGGGAGTVTTTAGNGAGVFASAPAGAVIGATTNGGAQAGQLPQTGNQSEAALAAMGVAGMLAALGFTKTGKKREA